MKFKACVVGIILAIVLLNITACGKITTHGNGTANDVEVEHMQYSSISEEEDEIETLQEAVSISEIKEKADSEFETMLLIDVNGASLEADLADNSSARALLKLIENEGSLTLELNDYAGVEKVGPLPDSLPTNDERISTDYGDIILYQGNQFVLYYDTNAWTFTRLAHVRGVSKNALKEILGTGNVTVTLRLSD